MVLGKVADSNCGENFFHWSKGFCYEYNSAGKKLGKAEDSQCDGENLFVLKDGICKMYNATGKFLKAVDSKNCENLTTNPSDLDSHNQEIAQ